MDLLIIVLGGIGVIVLYGLMRFLISYLIQVGIFAVKVRQSNSKKYTYTYTPKTKQEREDFEQVFGKYMKHANK